MSIDGSWAPAPGNTRYYGAVPGEYPDTPRGRARREYDRVRAIWHGRESLTITPWDRGVMLREVGRACRELEYTRRYRDAAGTVWADVINVHYPSANDYRDACVMPTLAEIDAGAGCWERRRITE